MQLRLNYFRTSRFKMIVGYEAWNKHLKPAKLMLQAILKTLVEKVTLEVIRV